MDPTKGKKNSATPYSVTTPVAPHTCVTVCLTFVKVLLFNYDILLSYCLPVDAKNFTVNTTLSVMDNFCYILVIDYLHNVVR